MTLLDNIKAKNSENTLKMGRYITQNIELIYIIQLLFYKSNEQIHYSHYILITNISR